MKDKTDKRSLGALLLYGGDWHGIRVMGCGERLAVIGISCVTSLLCLYAAGYFPSRREMSGDPGRRDGDCNRRDGGGENRVEALEKPSSGAPSAFIELTPSTIGESSDGCFDGNAIVPVEDSARYEAILNQFGGNLGIVTNNLNGDGAFSNAAENVSVLRIHAEIVAPTAEKGNQ